MFRNPAGFLFLFIALVNCSGSSNNEVSLSYNYIKDSIPIGSLNLSTYYDSDIFSMRERDIFVGYNHTTHSFDFFDLTKKQFSKSLVLKSEGPNAIKTVGRFAINKDYIVIIYGNAFIYFLNHDGSILKKIKFDELSGFEGLSLAPVELTFGNYAKLAFNEENILTLPVYKSVKRLNDDFYDQFHILDIHFDGVTITSSLTACSFPPKFSDNFYGDLDLPYVNRSNGKLFYNFPVSSTIFQISEDSNSETHHISELNSNENTETPAFNKALYNTSDRMDYFFNSPRYFYPIFDPYRELYYIVRKNKTETSEKQYEENYLIIMNKDLDYLDSIKISSDLTAIYDVTKDGLVFLYNQASIDSESYISFYTITVSKP